MHQRRLSDDITSALVVLVLTVALCYGLLAVDPICVGCP
jgi:hypothetical protein